MCPGADVSDGAGDAAAYLGPAAYWKAVGMALCGAATPPGGQVLRGRWKTARIESSGTLQVDGESVAPGAFDVQLESAALLVVGGGSPPEE
jgi:hypothetical protein